MACAAASAASSSSPCELRCQAAQHLGTIALILDGLRCRQRCFQHLLLYLSRELRCQAASAPRHDALILDGLRCRQGCLPAALACELRCQAGQHLGTIAFISIVCAAARAACSSSPVSCGARLLSTSARCLHRLMASAASLLLQLSCELRCQAGQHLGTIALIPDGLRCRQAASSACSFSSPVSCGARLVSTSAREPSSSMACAACQRLLLQLSCELRCQAAQHLGTIAAHPRWPALPPAQLASSSPVSCGARLRQHLGTIALILDGLRCRQAACQHLSCELRCQAASAPRHDALILDGLRCRQRSFQHLLLQLSCELRCQARQRSARSRLILDGLRCRQRSFQHLLLQLSRELRCQARQYIGTIALILDGLRCCQRLLLAALL